VRESAIDQSAPFGSAIRGGIGKKPAAPAAFYGIASRSTKLFAMTSNLSSRAGVPLAELRRRGFAGPKLRIAKHATVYTYERRR